MFNFKNKTDRRIRFQDKSFKRQLEAARGYKRSVKKVSEKKWEFFLSNIGFGGWPSRLAALAVFAGLVYLVYIPNFLYIKHIEIVGAGPDNEERITADINKYFSRYVYLAQRNIILLSSGKLSSFLPLNNDQILNVTEIKKDYPDKIILTVEPRVPSFLISTKGGLYIISNDGLAMSLVSTGTPAAAPALPQLTIIIKEGDEPEIGERHLPPETLKYIFEIQHLFQEQLKIPFNTLEFHNIKFPDIEMITQAGYKIYLDKDNRPADLAERLPLILNSLSAEEKNRLFYLDMRFPERGYACLTDHPCAREPVVIEPAMPTTTPSSVPANPATTTLKTIN